MTLILRNICKQQKYSFKKNKAGYYELLTLIPIIKNISLLFRYLGNVYPTTSNTDAQDIRVYFSINLILSIERNNFHPLEFLK